MKFFLTSLVLLFTFTTSAQPREEIFDYSFHPTKTSPFYYVATEKKDSVWKQEAYYISTSRMARECSYKDEKCTIPQGSFISYNVDGYAQQKGNYVNGKKEGTWLGYNDKGYIVDSGTYVNDHLKGVRMRWYSNGMASDSMNFDGAGNGMQLSWSDDGALASAGFWMQDSLKKGRWQYFFHDGKIQATEDYVKGKLTVCNCFTEKGEAIDTALCREQEAKPAGAVDGWIRFLQKSLQTIVENLAAKGARPGNYTVVIKFVVLEDGRVSDLTPLTKFGHGIEEEVMAAMYRSPKWEPARQFGKNVKSYHTQPITFAIQE